jgi:peroxiredoxin
VYADIVALGASLVVISPELPQRTADMAAKQRLTFPIVWDEMSRVAEAFGLAFTLPDDLRQVYVGFGNDLAVRNGDPSWRLPVPARFVIDAAGIVRSVEADPDYRYRPEPEATLGVLREVVGQGHRAQ